MASEMKRGQSISFRIPSDTPDHIIKSLQKLRETERRNFSSKMAEFVINGVGTMSSSGRETIRIPMPRNLTKSQKDWLKHEHSEALLGSIVYQLINDPVRATTLLAALNSKSTDIEEALYLQEAAASDKTAEEMPALPDTPEEELFQEQNDIMQDDSDDDFADFNWEDAKKDLEQERSVKSEEQTEDLDELLGGFLAHMNR
ncbi:hypothetical protein ACQCT6_07485 [Cytobacillus gottheilii]|uniref:Plasmid segregation centromere-binding protein ParR n=1 Tax=Cytobacillus gottheilii TaxID=859144 RepID=A0ABX8FAM7_9BACI|nr:hypothetical protein [Cytobacillus gottheilii]QVY61461.1 hypothetical protein J1899_21415 [Cytobacillus gottheilii]